MGKNSLKKETRVRKQKQKQKQSQKVVVNIGTNVLKPKRRRKATGPIEKKGINKQQPTTVYIPQSLPVMQSPQPPNSMSEFVKYLKESEKQKEKEKEKEKKPNELEKEKKEEERSKVLTKDEVQDNFSTVFSTSKLPPSYFDKPIVYDSTSKLPPLPPSYFDKPIVYDTVVNKPTDYSIFDKLKKEADLRDENPNSGILSFADVFRSPSPISIFNSGNKQTINDIIQNIEPPEEIPELIIRAEDPVIDEVLEELPENQIVIYGPQRVGQTGTATAQFINPIDNSIPRPLPFRINKPLPTIRISDIIAENSKPLSLTQISEKERMREARLKAVESNKPLLAIEPQSSQADAEDTIKLLEKLLSPNKTKPVFEEDDDKSLVQGDSPELKALKAKLTDRNFKRKDMVNLLSKNGITEKDGLTYKIYAKNVNLGPNSTTKTALTEHILKEFNEGKITKL